MADAYFTLSEGSAEAATYVADASTAGPWAADRQHGGPPSALTVLVAEQLAAKQTGRADLVALRLAAEFVGPVPVGQVRTRASVVRAARTAALVDVTMTGLDERDCLHARVWLVGAADTVAIAVPLADPVEPPPGEGLAAPFPYASTIEWRSVHGPGLSAPGPSAFWARPLQPILAEVQLSGLQRAALIGDSASGISSELDWHEWSFVNVDLDVHLGRPVEGEWVLMDAVTQLGPAGSALTRSTLSDVRGPVGATLQTLVVETLRR